jgi:hypothetical protein
MKKEGNGRQHTGERWWSIGRRETAAERSDCRTIGRRG